MLGKARSGSKAAIPKDVEGNEDAPPTWIPLKEEIPESLTLFKDRSSCLDGLKVRLILTNPEGVEFTYALRFEFMASNNEIEAKPVATITGHQIKKFVWDNVINGLVERANRSLGEGIKARLDQGSKDLVEKVPHVLWAHHTMIKTSNGNTPFSLTYCTKVVILVEIGMPLLRCTEIDQVQNDEALLLNLDILEERREKAAVCEAKNKGKDGNVLQHQSP
ncbi:reverse transcriptase domain-containing protein [Tanacetum coccineum]